MHGTHTFKTGYYYYNSVQQRGTGATSPGRSTSQNDTNNPLDTSFGFANAALGVFARYQQSSRWGEGDLHRASTTRAFVQDNWKVSERLTLDYGVRFVHQVPQYDGYLKSSNFLPEEWSAATRRGSTRRLRHRCVTAVPRPQPAGDGSA